MKYFFIMLCLIVFSISKIWAQTENPTKNSRIELKSGAKLLIGSRINGEDVRTVIKDEQQLLFIQDLTSMYCDSANQFLQRNHIEAFGNIVMYDADSTKLVGDTLYYDGNTRLARLRGNVRMFDKEMIVTTQHLNYDLNTKTGYYFNGGTVTDTSGTVLTSEKGYYHTDTKQVHFKGNVAYNSPDTHLESDTLTYNTLSKIVFFNAETKIKTRDGFLVTQGGEYNTELGTSIFQGRSNIETSEYLISADILDYDKLLEKGIAQKNVSFYLKKDKITIYGNIGKHDGLKGVSEVFGDALMIKPDDSGKDTLFLAADTLISISDTVVGKRLLAFPKVKIYRQDFQGKCDSLAYLFTDSIIKFYDDPLLWAGKNQLTADSIAIKMKNNVIDTMNLYAKAFVISLDTLLNYNQIKGRQITAAFKKNKISNILVNGNAESVFHVLQNDTLFTGLNRMQCGDMKIIFSTANKLTEILFVNQPEARYIPPRKLKEVDRFLENFTWRLDEKPNKNTVKGTYHNLTALGEKHKKSKLIADELFQVFLGDSSLVFYRADCHVADIKLPFLLHIFPENKKDISIENRQRGYLDLGFEIPEQALFGRNALYELVLPKFKIAKIIVGQQDMERKKTLWKKKIEF